MRIDRALESAAARLRQSGVASPRLDAEVLLAVVLEVGRHHLVAHADGEVPPDREGRFHAMVDRRCRREPIQYIIGRQEFWSLSFTVGPGLLIPRPETELLVELALAEMGRDPGGRLVVDLGSGSGNIGVVLAIESPLTRVVAVDIERAACLATSDVAAMQGVSDRVSVVRGDLLTPFAEGGEFDLVVSNPPYITESEYRQLQPEVGRFEPPAALLGGKDGLDVIRRIVATAPGHLRAGGSLMFEAGAGQAGEIAALIERAGGWDGYTVHRDLAGLPRVHHLKRSR